LAVEAAIETLSQAVKSGENVMQASIALARVGGTTGEWTAAIETATSGRYSAPLGEDGARGIPLEVPEAKRPIRIVLGKSGLDGHVNAVKLLAVACARAGMEVIYTGIKRSPKALVQTAVQEGADLLGISSLSGAHLHIALEVKRELQAAGATELPVVMGGIISDADRERLLELGVAEVFSADGAQVGDIVERLIALAN